MNTCIQVMRAHALITHRSMNLVATGGRYENVERNQRVLMAYCHMMMVIIISMMMLMLIMMVMLLMMMMRMMIMMMLMMMMIIITPQVSFRSNKHVNIRQAGASVCKLAKSK